MAGFRDRLGWGSRCSSIRSRPRVAPVLESHGGIDWYRHTERREVWSASALRRGKGAESSKDSGPFVVSKGPKPGHRRRNVRKERSRDDGRAAARVATRRGSPRARTWTGQGADCRRAAAFCPFAPARALLRHILASADCVPDRFAAAGGDNARRRRDAVTGDYADRSLGGECRRSQCGSGYSRDGDADLSRRGLFDWTGGAATSQPAVLAPSAAHLCALDHY